jgi:hypothetical protein
MGGGLVTQFQKGEWETSFGIEIMDWSRERLAFNDGFRYTISGGEE